MTLIWNSRISKYRSVPTSFLEWVVLGLLSLLDSQLLNRKMSLNAVWLGATLLAMLSTMSAQGALRCCSGVCMDSSRRCARCCAAHPVETAALLLAPALKLFASCKLRCRQPAPGALLWSCAEHQEVPEHSPEAQHVAPWSMAMGPCIATNAPPRLITLVSLYSLITCIVPD